MRRLRGASALDSLLELAGVAVTLSALAGLAVVLGWVRDEGRALVRARTTALEATALLSAELGNAGYHWADPAAAVQVEDAASAGDCGLDGWEPVPGSDVVTLAVGRAGAPAEVAALRCDGGACTARLSAPAGFNDGTVLVYGVSSGRPAGCLARLADHDGGAVAALHAVQPEGCPPLEGARVSALAGRTRYLTCRSGTRVGLVRRTSRTLEGWDATELTVAGVVDLQVGVVAGNPDGALFGPGCGAAGRGCVCDGPQGGCLGPVAARVEGVTLAVEVEEPVHHHWAVRAARPTRLFDHLQPPGVPGTARARAFDAVTFHNLAP